MGRWPHPSQRATILALPDAARRLQGMAAEASGKCRVTGKMTRVRVWNVTELRRYEDG